MKENYKLFIAALLPTIILIFLLPKEVLDWSSTLGTSFVVIFLPRYMENEPKWKHKILVALLILVFFTILIFIFSTRDLLHRDLLLYLLVWLVGFSAGILYFNSHIDYYYVHNKCICSNRRIRKRNILL